MEFAIVWAVFGWLTSALLSIYFITGGLSAMKRMPKSAAPFLDKRIYGITALSAAAISVYAIWLFGPGLNYISLMALTTFLISITPEDICNHTVDNKTIICFGLLFAFLRILVWDPFEIIDAALGFLCGMILIGVPWLIRRSWIGIGDIKVAACCGILLGPIGIFQFMIRAFFLVAVYSLIQLLRKKVEMKSELPFAPFMLLAALL